MKKFLALLTIASLSLWTLQSPAQDAADVPKKTVKKIPAKKIVMLDEEEEQPDTHGSSVREFHCELGNSVTIYLNEGDSQHLALRWLKRIHRLTRVETSTGADRFENSKAGLVWIGIPGKNMLLDSKKGRQLANECKTAEQM